jgi:hypothetical protein
VSLTNKRKILLVVVLPVCAALGAAFLLTGFLGPSDWGLRCTRSPARECRVLQTRLLGLVGNSDFAIPEEEIRDVRTVRSLPNTVGSRTAPVFTVNLILDPKWPYPSYPVLSYKFERQADSSTEKLKAYFDDKSVPSVEIKEDVLTPLAVGLAPVVFVAGIVGLRLWLRKKSRLPRP